MFPSSSIPRPEYPRPDFQRGLIEGTDWLNLNGAWQFRFDPDRAGLEEHWFAREDPGWRRQIIVPFCWESLAAWGEGEAAGNRNYYATQVFLNPLEVTHENHRVAPRHEVGWYRRLVKIPEAAPWKNGRVILHVGAADFFTDCWCNGVHCGRHEGGYTPFEFDLTEQLVKDGNGHWQDAWIVLRVEDPMDHHEQPVGKQWGWYTTTSGIWQTVYLEPRPQIHIESFKIIIDIDEATVDFEVFVEGGSDGCVVSVEIIPPEGNAMALNLGCFNGVARGYADVYPIHLWDTQDPKLYQVVFRLVHDELIDEVKGYFGMRKIASVGVSDADAPAMLCLNNKPIYLRGVLYQSYFPDGVYTAMRASTLRDDIAFAKKVGFDFLRIHIKLDDPMLLYYADTLGILVMQDFPNFGEGGDTPLGRRRFEEMMVRGMKRDFNHPSIIAWCIFNESWGFGGQNELMKGITPGKAKAAEIAPPGKVANLTSFQWIHEMWEQAKRLDPFRLVEDMSVVVWEHLAAYGHVDTDVNSWHFYINDYEKAKAHIEGVVNETYQGSAFNYIEGRSQRNVPLINSEYGGVGALDGEQDISWSFKFLTNELRRHGELSAYIFTELTDVEWEQNGFLNYDRTPKDFGYNPNLINQGDVLPVNAPPIARCRPGSALEVEVLSSHFSRRERKDVSLHWIYSGMDMHGLQHPALQRGSVPIAFSHHRVELAKRIELQLPAEPMLCTLAVAAVDRDGETVASNYVQHLVLPEELPQIEQLESSTLLRRRVHEWTAAEWSGGQSSREEAIEAGSCCGRGHGYFQWDFEDACLEDLGSVPRLCLLMEVSSRREGHPQTSTDRQASRLALQVNGVTIYHAVLRDHPHDSRGSLSFLRGAKGAYGYPVRAVVEGELLMEIGTRVKESGRLELRLCVSADLAGGLTLYDFDCGRFPFGPTVIIERPSP